MIVSPNCEVRCFSILFFILGFFFLESGFGNQEFSAWREGFAFLFFGLVFAFLAW